MTFQGQKILPAIRSMKDFDKMLKLPYEYGVFLDIHIGMVKEAVDYARQQNKKMFVHIDLIHGLCSDEYALEFLKQYVKPYGIISTKGNVILKARQQKDLYTTQRAFIIDSSALERSIKLIEKTNPDFVEILPGLVPKVIHNIHVRTGKPIFAGGLIETADEVEVALKAGACAITTSNKDLWKLYS